MKRDVAFAGDEVKFLLSYKNRSGVSQQAEFVAKLKGQDDSQNPAVRKAVLLSRYGNLLSDWIVYERAQHAVDDNIMPPFELSYASNESHLPILPSFEWKLGEWEQKSVQLSVSSDYQPAMAAMMRHFELESGKIGDKDLVKELTLLKVLSEK
jgi:Ca-activated chloride channel family protein